MSHFAQVENGIVTQVIVADQDFIDAGLVGLGWLQTSYNTRGGVHYSELNEPDNGIALRGNYAGIGYIYDLNNDVFYPQQPYPSWVITAPSWTWEAPIPYPTDKGVYSWDEDTTLWVATTSVMI